MPNTATGPAADDAALDAHLFLCLENGHYAVSTDPSGLGVREALPFPADPEPVVRGVRAAGYHIYGSSLPHGTSQ